MTDGPRRRTLSVRAWFAFAAIATFGLVVAAVLASVGLFGVADYSSKDRIAHATTVLRDGADRWDDPSWCRGTVASLGDDGVSFVLTEGTDVVCRSDNVVWGDERGDGIVRSVTIDGTEPPRTAQVYAPLRDDDPLPTILRATVLIGAVAAAVALAFGRPFVRSLRSLRQGAQQVAEGQLAVRLPESRIAEVDDVNAAFDAMTTELDRSLRQQADLEHERRLLIAAVAHDLRTPLFSLRGYLEGLETGLADTPEKRARYLAIASEKARTLERLVANLFDFTRLDYLDQPRDVAPLDLAELLQDVVDGLQPQAAAQGLTLALWPHDHSCPLEADRDQLTRAVINLADNALRYTPRGGRVDLACSRSEDEVWFTVSDTGPGIDADDLPHVFRPLYRGSRARSDDAEGTGLGLAIAERIVAAHHGTLVAGNAPDAGAVFTAALPAHQPADARSDGPATRRADPEPERGSGFAEQPGSPPGP